MFQVGPPSSFSKLFFEVQGASFPRFKCGCWMHLRTSGGLNRVELLMSEIYDLMTLMAVVMLIFPRWDMLFPWTV